MGCDRIDEHKVDGIRYYTLYTQRLQDTGTLELRPRSVPPNKSKLMLEEMKKKCGSANIGKIPHNRTKFTEEQISSILSDNRSINRIAKDFRVTNKVIDRIKNKTLHKLI